MALEVKWITEATGTNYPRDTAAPIVIHLVYRSFLTVSLNYYSLHRVAG